MGCVSSHSIKEPPVSYQQCISVEAENGEQKEQQHQFFPRRETAESPSELRESFERDLEELVSYNPGISENLKNIVLDAFKQSIQAWEGQEVILDTLSPYAPAIPRIDGQMPKSVKMNIDLSNQLLGDYGAFLVQLLLRPKYRVERLSLSGCGIGKFGGNYIARELRYNGVLRYIDLSNNPLGNAGVEPIVSHWPKAARLQSIDLSNTNIDNEAAKQIAVVLLCDKKVKELNLSHNNIDSDGLDALCMAAKASCKLTKFSVANNPGNRTSSLGSQTYQNIIDQIMESRSITFDILTEIVSNSVEIAFTSATYPLVERESQQEQQSTQTATTIHPDLSQGTDRSKNMTLSTCESSTPHAPTDVGDEVMESTLPLIGEDQICKQQNQFSLGFNQTIETSSTDSTERLLEPNFEESPVAATALPSLSGKSKMASGETSSKQGSDSATQVVFASAESIGHRHSMLDYTVTVPDFMGTKGDHLFAIFDGHIGPHCARFSAANFPTFLELQILKSMRDMRNHVDHVHTHSIPNNTVPSSDSEISNNSNLSEDQDLVRRKRMQRETRWNDSDEAKESKGDSSSIHRSNNPAFSDIILSSHDIQKCLRDAFDKLNRCVYQMQIPHGSCALVCYLRDSVLYTASLGDSKAVLYSKGNTESLRHSRLSRTFRPSDKDETERIKNLNGIVANDGRLFGLAVSRAVGDLQYQPYLSTEPHIESQRIVSECCLIMASDGMWDRLEVDQVGKELACNLQSCNGVPTCTPYECARILLSKAIENGSRDNISVILAKITPPTNYTSVVAA